MSVDDAHRYYELFQAKLERLGPRPPWWRMLACGRWERQYRELSEQLRATSMPDLGSVERQLQRLRAEMDDLRARNLELSHTAGQVEGMRVAAEFSKRDIARLESQVEFLRSEVDRLQGGK